MKKPSKKELELLENDNIARMEHHQNKKTKNLSKHDLKVIKPLTDAQEEMMKSYMSGSSILATGSAGSGKTYIALYLALNDLLDKKQSYERISIVRSVVATRDIGFLPGDMEEKIEVYETPYIDMFSDLFGGKPTCYKKFKEQNKVHFMPTSFLRGQTWDNTIVVVDEAQNMNFHEINTIMTRIGHNSKVIIVGDSRQTDLFKTNKDQSYMTDLERVLRDNRFFDTVHFNKHDIVRSAFVKSWIECTED